MMLLIFIHEVLIVVNVCLAVAYALKQSRKVMAFSGLMSEKENASHFLGVKKELHFKFICEVGMHFHVSDVQLSTPFFSLLMEGFVTKMGVKFLPFVS